jgi:hypothetical protein
MWLVQSQPNLTKLSRISESLTLIFVNKYQVKMIAKLMIKKLYLRKLNWSSDTVESGGFPELQSLRMLDVGSVRCNQPSNQQTVCTENTNFMSSENTTWSLRTRHFWMALCIAWPWRSNIRVHSAVAGKSIFRAGNVRREFSAWAAWACR